MLRPLTTQLVGSYTKPQWLADHDLLLSHSEGWWRPDRPFIQEARADAARLAIFDQERAGLDLLTDGEAQRQYFVSHFISRLSGVDTTQLASKEKVPTEITTVTFSTEGLKRREERFGKAPRIVDEPRWPGPLSVDEVRFLKRHTRRPVKATVVGPVTAVAQLADEHFGDEEEAAMGLAAALNEELKALEAEGVDLLQIDEPGFHDGLSRTRRYGVKAINRMVEGISIPVAVHVCYGYAWTRKLKNPSPSYAECLNLAASCNVQAISLEYEQPGHRPEILYHCGDKHVILGLLDLGTEEIETPERVAARLREALEVVPPERLHTAPDCGMWHLPREVAFAKIRSLVLGTEVVRLEHASTGVAASAKALTATQKKLGASSSKKYR
jgi:5-methyltetrahydropteroyltriglutamate--homocysteine methyltransferase